MREIGLADIGDVFPFAESLEELLSVQLVLDDLPPVCSAVVSGDLSEPFARILDLMSCDQIVHNHHELRSERLESVSFTNERVWS